MPFRPSDHLKNKHYWPVEHYSIPAGRLCYHYQEGSFDCPCVKPAGHAGKHEYVFSPIIKDHPYNVKPNHK